MSILIFNMQFKSHTASLFSTFSLITVTQKTWNMTQPWMPRQLVGLEVKITTVDIISSYDTHCKSRNKSQISETAKENSLSPTQASNNTHDEEAATPLNMHSPPRDSSELITLSYASQNSTRMQCYFHHLWNHFINYLYHPVLDGAVIYTGDVPLKYNDQEGKYTEICSSPTGNILLASRDMNSC